jgi:hypothetical protein
VETEWPSFAKFFAFSSSFAENPPLKDTGMNAQVEAESDDELKGFLLRRIPRKDEWRL